MQSQEINCARCPFKVSEKLCRKAEGKAPHTCPTGVGGQGCRCVATGVGNYVSDAEFSCLANSHSEASIFQGCRWLHAIVFDVELGRTDPLGQTRARDERRPARADIHLVALFSNRQELTPAPNGRSPSQDIV